MVDDDRMVNDLICRILKGHYEVKSYTSAEEMLHGADLTHTDVVITDNRLPGMDGLNLLRELQRTDYNIPVIMITGYAELEDAIEALKSGAFDFILKPFNNEQIIISVQKALDSRELVVQNIALMEQLKTKNRELESLYKNIQTRNMEIEKELDIAGNLQRCLFPVSFPPVRGFEFALKYLPVEKISGDFFDFIVTGEDRFSFIFADVSGHGVPAALYSAMVKTALSSVSEKNLSPSESISETNRFLINAQKTMSYNYATLFYGIFDLTEGKLHYSNAGIPAPMVIRENEKVEFLGPNGTFVGIFDTAHYRDEVIAIGKGDRFIFYTDGVFECANSEDKIMGQKIFLELLSRHIRDDIDTIVESLFGEIINFCEDRRYSDDITLLAMNYSGIK